MRHRAACSFGRIPTGHYSYLLTVNTVSVSIAIRGPVETFAGVSRRPCADFTQCPSHSRCDEWMPERFRGVCVGARHPHIHLGAKVTGQAVRAR